MHVCAHEHTQAHTRKGQDLEQKFSECFPDAPIASLSPFGKLSEI